LLASAAASQNREAPWNDDELAEDVATISYERAVRTHARFSPPLPDLPCNPESKSPGNEARHSTASKRLKTASITIRLGETECAQLRRRAAEAGMTISAYLRSCTLEVESLRAQVKQTLAELRSSPLKAEASQSRTDQKGWLARIFGGVKALFGRFGPRRQPEIFLNPANPFAPVRR
jgi:hypothetical protein